MRDFRIGVYVDVANIHAAINEYFKHKLDYQKLINHALKNPNGGDYKLFRAIVYAVKFGDEIDKWISSISKFGFEARYKEPTSLPGGKRKADWDIGICMDIVRTLELIDMVVLVSGDGDFIPLVQWCQDRGRIVKVYGVERSTSRKLIDACDVFQPIDSRFFLEGMTNGK